VCVLSYPDIGLLEGADRTFGGFLLHNLIPVTLGNFVGGGLFLGVAQWATYDKGNTRANGYLSVRSNDDDGDGDGEDVEAGAGARAASRQSLIAVGSINNSGGKGRV
jgi:hypothetical protein